VKKSDLAPRDPTARKHSPQIEAQAALIGEARWRAFAPVVVLAAALFTELVRFSGFEPPVPFLLLFGSVVLAAATAGTRAGLISAAIASSYIVYSAVTGFGPAFLTNTVTRSIEGVVLITAIAYALGRMHDQNLRFRLRLEDEARARYRALIRNAPEAIVVADADGNIIDCNPRALSMFEVTGTGVILPNVAQVSPPLQPDGRPSGEAARDWIRKALAEGPVTFEWLHQRTDGTVFPCEVSLSFLPDREQTLVRGTIRDISDRKRADALRDGEYAVLQSIARGEPMTSSLGILARLVESVIPGSLCTILKLQEDENSVFTLAAPSVSATYSSALNGLKIGPTAGSCGTAMYYDRQVISNDLELDPNWEPYIELARREGLRACWSTPIHDSTGKVTGSFAVYYREPREPVPEDLDLISRLTGLAGITIERWRNTEILKHREAIFRATFEHAAVGIAHVAPDGRYMRANAEFCRMLGYTEGELTQLTFRDVTHPDDVDQDVQCLKAMQSGEIDSCRVEKRWIRKNGAIAWVNVSVGTVRNDDGSVERFVVVAEDVSSAHDLSQQLTYQARHDPLTGLINRHEFEHRLDEFLREVVANEEQGAFCYLDLDQFKLVNDTAGHVAGDELLRQLAPRLRETMRAADTLARLGGDEFGVLLVGCDRAHAIAVAEKLRKVVEEFTFVWEGHSFKPGVSIGVVPLDSDALTSVTDVLQAADTTCYAAKDAGRNRYMVWREDDARLFQRRGEMQWIPRLNRAIDEGRLVFEAQSIVSLNSKDAQTPWYELLVRMQEGDELIPPGAFLPAAERYDLAPRLDRAVVQAALAWLESQSDDIRLSVNLSGQTFSDPGFRSFLINELAALGRHAGQLCFEITETAAISNLADAATLIDGVRKFGCTIALDDFGSGLSSFAYLKNLPVDYLKIDGTFVRDIARDPIDRAIVQSIHDVGRVMDKLTIAEFVEDEEVMAVLREIGVDYAQGFWTGRPTRIEQLRAKVAQH
jgi:diguanylate cyclase (GGDEF)-like protein/PAS domain S-box-containing protein